MKEPDHKILRERLFRTDGKRLRAFAYVTRSNKRPASIRVTFASTNKGLNLKSKETAFSLEGNDFDVQYSRAVAALADYHDLPQDSSLRQEMLATAAEFLRHYNLKIRPVTIYEAVADEEVKN